MIDSQNISLKTTTLHITSGDIAGKNISLADIPGEVFVWHDILYDGPRNPGWPTDETLFARSLFIERVTGGGLDRHYVLETFNTQYAKLKTLKSYGKIILWFDACLFDQSMLCHILTCMRFLGFLKAELLCVDAFPKIVPYNGLGQLSPLQLESVYKQKRPLTDKQFLFAKRVDKAFANQDKTELQKLTNEIQTPLPWIPAAVSRWLQEQPDPDTGLGHLEQLALKAIKNGCSKPGEIFSRVSQQDTAPQFWGDITLWEKINSLANREPPLVRITGPEKRLPQWEGISDLKSFRIFPTL